MRILIALPKGSGPPLIMRLSKTAHIRKVEKLVNAGRYGDAIMTAVSRGVIMRENIDYGTSHPGAELILAEDHAHRDLTVRDSRRNPRP